MTPNAGTRIDFKQASELLEMFGGEPLEITLGVGNGHSGLGLYASYTDMPEEGSSYLGVTDEEARPNTQTEPAFVTALIDGRRAAYNLDQSCTPEFFRWLDTMTPRSGVGANEAWNAGVAWQKTQMDEVAESGRTALRKLLRVLQTTSYHQDKDELFEIVETALKGYEDGLDRQTPDVDLPVGLSSSDVALIANAQALLDLDEANALVPHGIGGLARGIITSFIERTKGGCPTCTGCNGNGVVGGLRLDGYHMEQCPFCKGTGAAQEKSNG